MTDLTTHDMAEKLLAEGFARSGAMVNTVSDPIADTPMIITLDELRSYDLNPRVTRNPLYDEIKASIRERGLDAPPSITRRPGEPHYTIRNGGNTRLAILRELWAETRNEKFFRIPCLFRPWPQRGEIIALTGHLAENELHGSLTFIERALGVAKARELYEQEDGNRVLSQSELARRLTADGYPITQPHISRMQEAVDYLLPAIPQLLYGGLGRHQIEKLATLRKAGLRIWASHATGNASATDFPELFQEVVGFFDGDASAFSVKRLQDELVGQMAELLQIDYDTLLLEFQETEQRQHILQTPSHSTGALGVESLQPSSKAINPAKHTKPVTPPLSTEFEEPQTTRPQLPTSETNTVSPASTSERLQSIQQMIAERTGEPSAGFTENVLQAIPVQAGGLYPISDIWLIEPRLDTPEALRIHIAQFAREIAAEADIADQIEAIDQGIGYFCSTGSEFIADEILPLSRSVLSLLHLLSADYQTIFECDTNDPYTGSGLAALLLGSPSRAERLSDTALVKLFRLIRLARRLLEWKADTSPSNPPAET